MFMTSQIETTRGCQRNISSPIVSSFDLPADLTPVQKSVGQCTCGMRIEIRPEVHRPTLSELSEFQSLPLSCSKVISDFQKFSMNKWGPIFVADAIHLHAFVGLGGRNVPIESVQNSLITFELDNVKIQKFGICFGPLELHLGVNYNQS